MDKKLPIFCARIVLNKKPTIEQQEKIFQAIRDRIAKLPSLKGREGFFWLESTLTASETKKMINEARKLAETEKEA